MNPWEAFCDGRRAYAATGGSEGAICLVRTPGLVTTWHRIRSMEAGIGVCTAVAQVTDRKQR